MPPAGSSARRLRLLRAIGAFVVAVAVLALIPLAPDATGVAFAGGFSAFLVVIGGWQLRAALRTPRSARTLGFHELPTDARMAKLDRLVLITWFAAPAYVAFTARQFVEVEHGRASDVFLPGAWVYPSFGFWPAISTNAVFVVALQVGLLVMRRRSRQAAESAAER